MEETEQILKQDAVGRVWTPRPRREALLEEFERSGLPATKFAAHVGVKPTTFGNWVQKRRQERAGVVSQASTVPRWVEAAVEKPAGATCGALVVHLSGGARLEVSSAAQVLLAAQLLRALGRAGAMAC